MHTTATTATVPTADTTIEIAPAKAKRTLGRKLALLALGAIVIGAALPKHHDDASNASKTPSTEVTAAVAPGSASDSGTAVAAASSSAYTVSSDWRSDAVDAANGIAATTNDVADEATQASITGDTSDLTSACARGLDEVPDWRAAAAAVPDASISVPFGTAVDHIEASLRSCVDGDYESATTEIHAATADLRQATAAVGAAG